MKTHFKFQIILTVSLFFVIVFNANAQSGYSLDHQFKSGFNHDDLDKPTIEPPPRLDNAVPQKFLKNNFNGDLLDSLIYLQQENIFKETFTYNDAGKRLVYLNQIWSDSGNYWQNIYRYNYTYEESGELKEELFEGWDNTNLVWDPASLITYSYDSFGNILSRNWKIWDSSLSEWVNFAQLRFTYDENNNNLSAIEESWDKTASSWVEWIIRTYSYDNSNNLLSETKQFWDRNSSIWVNANLYTFSYDTQGNMLTNTDMSWNDSTNSWKNIWRETRTFGSNGNILSFLGEMWDDDSTSWQNNVKATYNYSQNGLTVYMLNEIWFNNSWSKTNRITENFNVNGNILNSLTERWEVIFSTWVNSQRKTYTYGSNSFLTAYISEFASGINWIPIDESISFEHGGYQYYYNCRELSAFYTPLTSIVNPGKILLESYKLSQNYPNPFNPSTTIEYELPQNAKSEISKVKLVVYDLLGSAVRTLVDEQKTAGKHKVTFDASQLPSGFYFYQITTGSFHQVKKMLLLK
jgi:hypothetical protein